MILKLYLFYMILTVPWYGQFNSIRFEKLFMLLYTYNCNMFICIYILYINKFIYVLFYSWMSSAEFYWEFVKEHPVINSCLTYEWYFNEISFAAFFCHCIWNHSFLPPSHSVSFSPVLFLSRFVRRLCGCCGRKSSCVLLHV